MDPAGNAYVSSSLGGNAHKITPAGVITQIITAAGDGAGNILDFPRGIAVDSGSFAYVTGFSSRNAFRIPLAGDGIITEIIDEVGNCVGVVCLDQPRAIAVDAAGNVYVGGASNVFKIANNGTGAITQIIDVNGDGTHALIFVFGIAVDAAGNVYVTGNLTDNAFKITPAGAITEIIDATGDGVNGLDGPQGIAVDAAGNVYVTGAGTDNVFKITPGGVITQIIDATGDGAGNSLDSPSGIAVDAAGNPYVVGTGSNNAFKITLSPDIDGDSFSPPADCDDADPNVNPGAAEVDNGIDDNCDGNVDEGFDGDGDGFTPIAGGDCDDIDQNVNPGASELNNGIDDNCDGTIDEGFDADGVDSATEDAAPNNGDGNDDGIPDSQQDNVASLPNVNGDFVTVASPGGTTLANVTSGANPSPGDAPAGVTFPAGFTAFEVGNLPAGGAVDVDIIVDLPPGVTINTYWKFGTEPVDPTPHWYEFLFDGTTGATISGNVITLHLVDGLRGDDDLTVNGVIVDPGAPALAPSGPGAQPAPSDDCGNGTCGMGTGMTMPMMLLGWMGLKRRRQPLRR